MSAFGARRDKGAPIDLLPPEPGKRRREAAARRPSPEIVDADFVVLPDRGKAARATAKNDNRLQEGADGAAVAIMVAIGRFAFAAVVASAQLLERGLQRLPARAFGTVVAAGVAGAFVVAHETVIDWLLQRARTYLFTTASPPAVAHTVSRSLELIAGNEGQARRAALQANILNFQSQLQLQRWSLLPSSTAIQPLLIGSNAIALGAAGSLDKAGLWVPAIRPPTVPAGTARLRIALSAAHAHADIARLCTALAAAEQENT